MKVNNGNKSDSTKEKKFKSYEFIMMESQR